MTREFKMLPVSSLVEPEHAARTEISDAGLDSLADSIRRLGILQNLVVHPRADGTYEVTAGHRRLLAARMVGLVEVPCNIEHDDERLHAVKLHENIEREELNPADEAQFYEELYQKLGQDTDALAATVRRTREHVEERLLLLRGQPEVLAALREGRITIGVARELNKMTRPEDRVYYLEYAIRAGASVRQARDWKNEANLRAELAAKQAAAAAQPGAGEAASPPLPPAGPSYAAFAKPYELSGATELRPCWFCGEQFPEWRTYKRFVCAPCADLHLVKIEREQAMMPPRGPSPVREG